MIRISKWAGSSIRGALISSSALTLSLAASGHALAQDEIIVTAQKRAESIQDVPLAITAYSGEFTRDVNLDDVKDLVTFTPGVTGNTFDSFIDYISIRGIVTNDFGVGGDPSVPFFKNGFYQGRNGAVVTSLYDIERAEVLRGPQGFLFGRNAIGGAISVHTTRPKFDAFGGYAELDVGERGRIVGEAAINIPLTENFAVRLAGFGAKENGYVDNFAYPNNDRLVAFRKGGGRFSAAFEKGMFDAFFFVEYEDRELSGSVYRATQLDASWAALVNIFGIGPLGGDGRDIDSDLGFGEADDGKQTSLGLELNFDLGGAVLTSMTGYKDHSYFYAEDFDGTPLRINDYFQDQEGEYFEQEIRLVSDTEGPLSWYAGVSYFKEDIDDLFGQGASEDVMCAYYNSYGFTDCASYYAYLGYAFTPNPAGLVEQNAVRGRYHGWAGYLDLTYELDPRFEVSAGVRYTKETKDFGIWALPVDSQLGPYFALGFTSTDFLTDKHSWRAFTPRFIARYRPNDDWMIFASATRGFKAGGFGSFTLEQENLPFRPAGRNLVPGTATPDKFEAERAWSYELGTKGSIFGGATKVDANVYYYNYKDLQVIVPGVSGSGIVVDNVGSVSGWGVEGSMQTALGEYFDFLLSAAYADTEVTEAQRLCDGTLDCEGASFGDVPKFSGAAVLGFNAPAGPGSITASAELFGQSKTFGGLRHLPEARNDAYAELALRLGYKANAGWSVIGYIENVTNALYYTGSSEGGSIIPARYFGPSRPRTFGVRMTYDFGG
ncbi:MAG: TonB-dependent receptor [Parvularculaceae bacterium]|nr:TonB-dependent receptor [Parvularculaceae bacterium]